MGQCCNLCIDCGDIHAVFVGEFAWTDWMDCVWNPVGDCVVRIVYENPKSKATTALDGGIICGDGVDVVVYITGDDT